MAYVGRFGPPIALMAFSWFLSAQPDLSSGIDGWDTPLRKAAHMTLFGVLLLLWWRALGPRRAVAITLAYAGVDEWHQTWVEGRHGALSDVAIDMLGGGIASALNVRRLTSMRRTPGQPGSTGGSALPDV
jgi:VanZ family protein